MFALALSLAACGSLRESSTAFDPNLGVSSSQRVVSSGKPVPRGGGVYKVGRPYKIAGNWYYPREDTSYDQVGMASWYGDDFHGRQTANGEIFDMNALSAAHPTLPMPTYARVTNLENGRSVVVRINDRGPYAHDRIIDLSARTAKALGFTHQGTTKVRVQYVGRAPLDGDDTWLTTTYAEAGRKAPFPDGTQVAMGEGRIGASVKPQDVGNTRRRGVLAGLFPRVGLSGYTPEWAVTDNRVSEAFSAIDASRRDRLPVSEDVLATIANDPARITGN